MGLAFYLLFSNRFMLVKFFCFLTCLSCLSFIHASWNLRIFEARYMNSEGKLKKINKNLNIFMENESIAWNRSGSS